MLPTFSFLLCSEFIGEDGNEKFWQFVDTVKELTVYKHGGMLFLMAFFLNDLSSQYMYFPLMPFFPCQLFFYLTNYNLMQ